jgi:hypothetical protein
VRKTKSSAQLLHAQGRAFGVTDLISESGFAGTCPAPNTYRGLCPTHEAPRGAASVARLHPRNDIVPSFRLQDDILAIARSGTVSGETVNTYGRKFEVGGILTAIRAEENFPRLVTVFPR